jgi:hypothetical protein
MLRTIRNHVIGWLPDRVYVPLIFYKVNRRFPDLRSPQRWTDKIQWLKLYGDMERFAPYADKYTVRSYVEKTIGSEYLIPVIGVWDRFDDISFSTLPKQFVLKVTHGCGYNYICKDKSTIDMQALRNIITGWQQEEFYKQEREPQYKPCVPRIICEEYLEDNKTGDLPDYKFYCDKGEPKIIQVDTNRFVDHNSNLFDLNWKPLDYVRVATYAAAGALPQKPDNLSEMLNVAGQLAKEFPFVRVDLYSINNKVYFGELTFTPGSGWVTLEPVSGDVEFGKMIDLNAYNATR